MPSLNIAQGKLSFEHYSSQSMLGSVCALSPGSATQNNLVYMLDGKSPRQCLKEGHCRALQVTFFECKRSLANSI
ncbi:cytochrome c oxidase assembly factor 5 isoform X4 [Protopterus annectens]|uniref:cytochrome c oxidase assembly factor 5 isoform X4 n=1 Tax=Protopterus annectens TaxID=7888 RepID=UPI001CFA100D|nr:cytochrome c oxidase assembly factor 5 isoform X4 [Protopterus annectens]